MEKKPPAALKSKFTKQALLEAALGFLRAEKKPGQALRTPALLTTEQTQIADAAAKAFPENFEIRLRLAIHYARSYKAAEGINNDQKALSLYAQAYAIEPDNIRLNMEYGRLLIKNRKFSGAEGCFIRCLQIEGMTPHALTRLGYTYEKWSSRITDAESKRTLEKFSLLCFQQSHKMNAAHRLAHPDKKRLENTTGETRALEVDWAEYEQYVKERISRTPVTLNQIKPPKRLTI